MKPVLPALILAACLSPPAAAEEEGENRLRDGLGLIQEGTRQLLRGLADEIDPMLRDLQTRIGDLSAYHPPEILPNGDILIRRKEPLPVPPAEGEIDL